MAVLRPVIGRIRYYLTAPVITHLDAINAETRETRGTARHHLNALESNIALVRDEAKHRQEDLVRSQKKIAQLQKKAVALSRALDAQGARTYAEVARLREYSTLHTEQITALQRDLGFAHGKLDELRHASRPLLTLKDATAVPLADGYVFLPPGEETLLLTYAAATSEGLEPGTRSVLQRLLRPGMIAVDVGANIGAMTLIMGRAVGPQGRVESFEAETRLRPYFERMAYHNGLSCVTFHNLALGREAGMARFNVSNIIGHSSLHALPEGEGEDTIEVEVKRLDDVLADGQTVDLVKIDVEGAETEVLAGMEAVLRRSPDPAVIAEFGISHLKRSGEEPRDWLARFEAFGLVPFAIQEPSGQCCPAEAGAIAAVESVNLAFVRPDGDMATRLAGEGP